MVISGILDANNYIYIYQVEIVHPCGKKKLWTIFKMAAKTSKKKQEMAIYQLLVDIEHGIQNDFGVIEMK